MNLVTPYQFFVIQQSNTSKNLVISINASSTNMANGKNRLAIFTICQHLYCALHSTNGYIKLMVY